MSDLIDIELLGAQLGLQVLKAGASQEIFRKCVRDIEVIARAKHLGPILRNTEFLVDEPEVMEYYFLTNDTITGMEMYRKEIAEYRDLERRHRLARCLLDFWIDDALREQLHEFDDPYNVWDLLHQVFGVELHSRAFEEEVQA